ncbi:thiamine phosphate synthase [Cochleicola gelatinilyticus]|uniref:Thiamine-phosphate synthase n=1 Tax=Cochleicola gelatinilyticus TaxID=1763537 RepID=A0A167GXB4_9FLAO|nr:thiamine phosphate synthase [Cochleicola gelatinilyticus]OAB78003.1 thiamine-phosphate pyrophosphorylase [Cochleicola gelatinilyticus]
MIPKLHYISQGTSIKDHLDAIQKACTSGAELVQLRLKNVSEKKFLKAAHTAREITAHFQTRLLINDSYKIAKAVKADGVHLGISDPCPTTARPELYSWQIIGGTAHTLQDCETLLKKDVDYISLGPFRATTTKEDVPSTVLGLSGYTAIMDVLQTETPVLGVGGITTEDVTAILATGISGVAVSEAISKNFNSIRTFNELLNASVTAEQRHTF